MDNRIHIKKYDDSNHGALIEFLQNCLPESGRGFDLQGRHNFYCDIDKNFKSFWVMFDRDEVIGTVAVKELDAEKCELKSLYLYERYHGNGLGRRLITKAIEFAAAFGYKYMYLDSLSTSTKALTLYKKVGFAETERYNQNEKSDVFMFLTLNKTE